MATPAATGLPGTDASLAGEQQRLQESPHDGTQDAAVQEDTSRAFQPAPSSEGSQDQVQVSDDKAPTTNA